MDALRPAAAMKPSRKASSTGLASSPLAVTRAPCSITWASSASRSARARTTSCSGALSMTLRPIRFGPFVVDLRMEDPSVDTTAAEQHDRFALNQRGQIVPVDPAITVRTSGVPCLPVVAVLGALIRGCLRDVGLPGRLFDPLPRTPAVLLAHGDGQVGVAEQGRRFSRQGAPKCPTLPEKPRMKEMFMLRPCASMRSSPVVA